MTVTDELLIRSGPIHVFDDERTVADAALFRGGRVAAVGSTSDVERAASEPRMLDLEGRPLLPGFNDAHAHLLSVGVDRLQADLEAATTRDEALSLLAEAADETESGRWVVGHNYDESTWPESDRRLLTRDDLDTVSEDHPIAAVRIEGHTAAANSPALERLDLAGLERDVRTDGTGTPTGVLVEDAAGAIKRATHPTGERAREALSLAIDRAHELGLTSVQTVAGLTQPTDDGTPLIRALFAAWREGTLDLRVTAYLHANRGEALSELELPPGFGDDRLRIGGHKTFSDGSIGAGTAQIYESYASGEGGGEWVMDLERLETIFAAAAAADQQVATHALGGRAVDEILDRYEAVLDGYAVDPRLRLEHVELATDEALERMAELGIVASMQPNFLQWDGDGGAYETALEPSRRGENNRFRDVLDAGVPLAFGSDTMPMGPLYGIHHAVNAESEHQRLSVDEAVTAYTRGAAHAEHVEDRKGTLEPGMLADAVVLEDDPFEHPSAIADIGVEKTIVGGSVVYERD
ncbi:MULTISPECIES: amidohydrolase [Natrialbaceae]|uniref:amidohydrolase n=1 Tax=Natrialbaceae TaxID=1644061 RepID=UPI00207C6194|nr:amidohydrolase [Natronococcus sp. CG52]